MLDKLISVLKIKNITIPGVIFFNVNKLGIDYTELYYLCYILNLDNPRFDLEISSKELDMKPKEMLKIINSLSEKNLLRLEKDKKSGIEILNLDDLYKKIAFISIDSSESESSTLFDKFEQEFKRPLGPREFQIILAWKESGYTEELITLALKEAVYNEVYNIAYIDKILNNWNKKGCKNIEDVKKVSEEYNKKKSDIPVLEDYDWLNE